MTRDVISCARGATIAEAEEQMQRAQVRRLPVTNASGRLVGILSLNDIAREAERARVAHTPTVGLDDVALTLSAVCKPTSAALHA